MYRYSLADTRLQRIRSAAVDDQETHTHMKMNPELEERVHGSCERWSLVDQWEQRAAKNTIPSSNVFPMM